MLLALCSVCLVSQAAENIVVLGDSLSAGYGIDIQQGWVALLQQRLQQHQSAYTVVNASISGDTTSNGLARLPAVLQQHQPKIVIVELGANDALRGIPLQATRSNLEKIITQIQQKDGKVLLLGLRVPPNYGPAYTVPFQALYKELARQYKVAVTPLFLAQVDERADLMQADNLHPTAAAQAILLENVWRQLEPMLKR